MKDNGLMTFNMAKVYKHGLMAVSMKDNITQAKRMERESIFGEIKATMMVIGLTTKLQEQGYTFGQMEEDTRAIG